MIERWGALVARRLVQHDQRLDVGDPGHAIDAQGQTVFRKHGIRVIHHLTIDLHQAVEDEPLAHPAFAKPLIKQDLIEGVVAGGQA